MTFMHMDATTAASASQFTVSLNGANINGTGGWDYDWGWSFKTDGFVEEYRNGFTNNIKTATDWIDPRTGFVSADYEVRGGLQSDFSSQSKSTAGSNAFIPSTVGLIGSWYSLSITRIFRFGIDTFGDHEFSNGWIRFEIRNVTNPSQNTLTSAVDAAPIMAVGETATAYYYYIEVGFE